jgi:molecular chaperone GrpE
MSTEHISPEPAAETPLQTDSSRPPQDDPLADPRIAELEAEVAEMKDRWVRAEAETQNVRARSRRDVDDARQYAVQSFAKDVAEAAENIRRGIDAMPQAGGAGSDNTEIVEKLREGFIGIERSFIGLLERHGIKSQDPTGAMFDPNLHQAMQEQESTDHPAGTVLQAWTQAWTLHGRLLRPAMVVVAKAPAVAIASAKAAQNDAG